MKITHGRAGLAWRVLRPNAAVLIVPGRFSTNGGDPERPVRRGGLPRPNFPHPTPRTIMNALFNRLTPALLLGALLLTGCGAEADEGAPGTETVEADAQEAVSAAVARIDPLDDSGVEGEVRFQPEAGGVRVVADLTGLAGGVHGFHVHENGDCDAADTDNDGTEEAGGAAGGHHNPGDDPHGAPTDPPGEHHIGDMGNITADASGAARLDTTFSFLTLSGPESVVGKALIVHGGRDDLTSQPSGDAGARVGCGLIEMASADATGMN